MVSPEAVHAAHIRFPFIANFYVQLLLAYYLPFAADKIPFVVVINK
jgi:hypothetical protein